MDENKQAEKESEVMTLELASSIEATRRQNEGVKFPDDVETGDNTTSKPIAEVNK